jgi:hypothetical protein
MPTDLAIEVKVGIILRSASNNAGGYTLATIVTEKFLRLRILTSDSEYGGCPGLLTPHKVFLTGSSQHTQTYLCFLSSTSIPPPTPTLNLLSLVLHQPRLANPPVVYVQ